MAVYADGDGRSCLRRLRSRNNRGFASEFCDDIGNKLFHTIDEDGMAEGDMTQKVKWSDGELASYPKRMRKRPRTMRRRLLICG